MGRNELIQMRRGTAAQWTAANPVLDSGELGVELDTDAMKIGDASTPWTALRYAMSPPGLSVASFGAKGDGVTNDTVAVQNAVNAASAAGASETAMVPVVFPAGRTYVLDLVIPSSWVDIQAYGALFKRTGVHNTGLFAIDPAIGIGSAIDHFALRGATLIGTQAEQTTQSLVLLKRSSNIWVQDCWIDNLNAPGVYIEDCQWVRVNANKLTRMGSAGNSINFGNAVFGSTLPLKYIWCQGNYVDHTTGGGECISIVSGNAANRTDPVIDAHITGNTVQSETSGGLIFVEQGGNVNPPPNISGIDISGNTVYNNSGAGNAQSIQCSLTASVPGNDPMCISGVTITGNRIFGSGTTSSNGILFDGSKSLIANNYIEASNNDVGLQYHGTAVNHHLTVKNNQGGLGAGDAIHLLNVSGFDLTTCSFDLDPNNGKLRQVTSGTAAPTTGTWRQGAICWNTTPGAATTLLWVCTTGGTPGTWTASTLP